MGSGEWGGGGEKQCNATIITIHRIVAHNCTLGNEVERWSEQWTVGGRGEGEVRRGEERRRKKERKKGRKGTSEMFKLRLQIDR